MVDRTVVGAHYGLRDWLAQRITAAIMAVYSVIALVVVLTGAPISYAVWKDLFAQGWMRVATLLFAVSLAWHAWVGVRDVLMDYIKPTGLRLALEVVTLLVLAGVFNLAFTSIAQTLVQLLAPPAVRGRVVGLFNTAILGLRAGSGVTVGVLGAVIDVHWSLALSAAAVALTAAVMLALEQRQRRSAR